MNQKAVLEGTELTTYLRGRLQMLLADNALSTSEFTEFYLVNLLQEFLTTDKLYTDGTDRALRPLALMFLEAASGDVATRIRCLKQLGDTALYLSSFFAEHLDRGVVDQDYYIGMGGSAYSCLAEMCVREKTFNKMYSELSENFEPLTNVLAEIAPWRQLNSNQRLLRLYEQWLRTGNEQLEQLLTREGLVLNTNKPQ